MNDTKKYMAKNGWSRIADGGTAGIYSNGDLFVMCNGAEWFASKTPSAAGRWAKGWANMLPAMKFADSKRGTVNQAGAIREKVLATPDKVYSTKVFQYWINGNGELCRARKADLDTVECEIEILD